MKDRSLEALIREMEYIKSVRRYCVRRARSLEAIMRRVEKLRSVRRYYVDRIISCGIGGGGALAGDFIVIRDVKDFSKESYLEDTRRQLGYVYDLNKGLIQLARKGRYLMDEDAPFGWEEVAPDMYIRSLKDLNKEKIMPFIFGDGKIPEQYIAAVALGFYDDDYNLGFAVNHKNWRKDDNRPDNLELCSLAEQKCHEDIKQILEKHELFEPWMALNASTAYDIVRSADCNEDVIVVEAMKAIHAYPEIGEVYTPIPQHYEAMPIDFGKDFEEAFQETNRKNWKYRSWLI